MTRCQIIQGDCRDVLKTLPDASVNCCVTSPPYWGLRDYGVGGQIGLEKTPEAYVAEMVAVFREVRRVLRGDGTLWLNLGDSYARNGGTQGGGNRELLHMEGKQKRMISIPESVWSLKEKDLVGIPWRVAFALQADGWYLRQDIIWHKPNPMPESVTDRCTKAHEYLFLLSKEARYYYDQEAINERKECWRKRGQGRSKQNQDRNDNGEMAQFANRDIERGIRNRRSVWTVATQSYSEAHFATFPENLIKPCILAGCPVGGTVLDPFGGSGTTGQVAVELARHAILIELNQDYVTLATRRTNVTPGLPL